MFEWLKNKSIRLYKLNAASCNNCEIELLACLDPKFDIEHIGITVVHDPREADVFVLTGPINYKNVPFLKDVLAKLPRKCALVALGACGVSCGIFKAAYPVSGPLDKFANVDAYVPGCPPKPEAIIRGIIRALKKKGRAR